MFAWEGSINGAMAVGNRGRTRYYCEKCRGEVKPRVATCPHCGSRFTAVRCPRCGYQGREADFRSGCPVCGYMVEPQASPPAPRGKKKGLLPPWFYRTAGIALVAAAVILLFVLLLGT